MGHDDVFEPRMGRQNARGRARDTKPVLHRVLAAVMLARGAGPARGKRGFSGSRIGRGAGIGHILSARDRFAALRRRRVMIKTRIVRLGGKGLAAAKAHMRYIQREGTTREGSRGELYSADHDKADRGAFLERSDGDRHQFRFIVAPEDGAEYEDLKPLTRRLMARMEEDLGTSLDWVAVDHFNTGHPHSHIVVRGKDDMGRDLVIARDYIGRGMRERAAELVDLDLGPRTDAAIVRRLSAEVTQQRLTSIDRMLIREADAELRVPATAREPFQQSLRTGRLRYLERLGLAEAGEGGWRIAPGLAETLRAMGERGDVIRTMQRAYSARGQEMPAALARGIDELSAPGARAIVGRVVERGLADELEDRHYLIVEATDGRSHYVAIGKGDRTEPTPPGSIVRLVPRAIEPREVDRTIAAVAAANEGRYSVDIHLAHSAGATEAFAEAHVRRLEAMRRTLGSPERGADGTWNIADVHLALAAAYEAKLARDEPLGTELVSRVPLERLVLAEAATWLDRELTAHSPVPLREAGFGCEVGDALARRRLWLIEQGLAREGDGQTSYPADLLATLRRRELLRVAGQLSEELGLGFAQHRAGERIEGVLRRKVDLVSGRYALIEKSREFTLVPWRPVLERELGKPVSGIMRESGISWEIGRGRSGPTIS